MSIPVSGACASVAIPVDERASYTEDVACTACELEVVDGIGYVHAEDCTGGEIVIRNLRFWIGADELGREDWMARTGVSDVPPKKPPVPGERGMVQVCDLECPFCGAPESGGFFIPMIHRRGCTNPDGWAHYRVAATHWYIDGVEVSDVMFNDEYQARRKAEKAGHTC